MLDRRGCVRHAPMCSGLPVMRGKADSSRKHHLDELPFLGSCCLSYQTNMYDTTDMARLLNRSEMLAATGVSGFVFDRMIKRTSMALTFGVVRAPVRDRYIASDPVFARTVIDLAATSRLPQPLVGTLVRLNNLVVLDAIVRAETEN